MNVKNKILLISSFILILSFPLLTFYSKAQTNEVNLYLFWGNGCPHCAEEKPFLETLKQKYPQLHVYEFEVWYNKENQKLLPQVEKILNTKIEGVPFTVVGDQYLVGYYNEATTGKQIEDLVVKCLKTECPDPLKDTVLSQGVSFATQEATTTKVQADLMSVFPLSKSVIVLAIILIIFGGLMIAKKMK